MRTWQTAHVMKRRRGALPGDGRADNLRARRYVAKYTICPAVAHGLDARDRLGRGRQARRPGAVGPGVLRRQARTLVVKGGMIAWAADGRRQRLHPHPAAGPAPADVRRRRGRRRRHLGALRRAGRRSRTAWPTGSPYGGRSSRSATSARVGKADMPLNDAMPGIEVDPDTFAVHDRRRADRTRTRRRNCPWRSATSSSDAAARAPPTRLPPGRTREGPMHAALLLLADSRLPAGGHAHSGASSRRSGSARSTTCPPWGLPPGPPAHHGRGRRRPRRGVLRVRTVRRPTGWTRLDAEVDARTSSPAQRAASGCRAGCCSRIARRIWPSPVLEELAESLPARRN